MKNKTEINFFNYILNTILAVIPTLHIYKILFNKITYTTLNDFYVGTSIYLNYNKYIDIAICLIYVVLFFLLLPITKFLTQLIQNRIPDIIDKLKPINIPYIDNLKRFQHIGLLGYILLHPLGEQIYINLVFLILSLIIIGFIDIKRRNNKTFSPFAIAPILFLLYFIVNNQTMLVAPSDDHHYGEQIATYFLHEKFNMLYYKDLMLVHGFLDIFPSLLGNIFFEEITIKASMLGYTLYNNLILLITLICSLYLFSNNLIFIAPVLFTQPHLSLVFISSYLLLMTKKITEKPIIWLILYILMTFSFIFTWTTIGTFCFIASIPFAFYMFVQLFKTKNKRSIIINLLILAIISSILWIISKDLVAEYLIQAQYYIKGNLFAFGNNFGNYDYTLNETLYFAVRLFAIIIIPYLILRIMKQIKEKDIKNILLTLFLLIFPTVSLSYAFGRIDGENFSRICNISTTYLFLVCPFFMYKDKSHKNLKVLFMQITLLVILINFGINIFKIKYETNIIEHYSKSNINTIGDIYFNTIDNIRISNIANFVKENSTEEEVFLDLTNRGMNYMYTNKKIPIPYTSYYNIISTKQNEKILENILENEPKIILIGFYKQKENLTNPIFDKIYPSLRINKLYRWLLLSKKYQVIKDKGVIYLLKSNKDTINYSKEEKSILDDLLANKNIEYLPEAWGNASSNLSMELQKIDFKTIIENNKITIQFNQIVTGGNIELILIKNINAGEFKIKINDEESYFEFKSKLGKNILIPFDNLPTFLLSENIKKITIHSNKEINKDIEIMFFKRM